MYAIIEYHIPYGYYSSNNDSVDKCSLKLDEETKDNIIKIMNEEGVHSLSMETVKKHLDVLQALHDSILQYGYELLIEDWLNPYNDCEVYENADACMDEDIRNGLYVPQFCINKNHDFGEDSDISEVLHAANKDDYLDWLKEQTQEFRAERYGCDIHDIFCDEVEYEITGIEKNTKINPFRDMPDHNWTMEDIYKEQAK